MTGRIAQKVAFGRGAACAVFTYSYKTLVVGGDANIPNLAKCATRTLMPIFSNDLSATFTDKCLITLKGRV